MKYEIKKQILIAVMVIALFVFVVSLSSLYAQRVISCGIAQTCTIPIPFLIPITSSIGLFTGTLVYYFMSWKHLKEEDKFKDYEEVIKKIINGFLSEEERKVFYLVMEKGKISQAELTKKLEMPRVKVFRIIERLRKKGLIEKKGNGKVRIIYINKKIIKYS